jgi:hypothetical protein
MQQQALSPITLAQRYTQLDMRPARQSHLFRGSIVVIVGLLILVMVWPHQLVFVVFLVFLLVFWLPMLLTRASAETKEKAEIYAQLLALLKDDTLPLPLPDRVTVLATLHAATQPPLLGIAQARLAQKLAYASPTELATLPRASRCSLPSEASTITPSIPLPKRSPKSPPPSASAKPPWSA